MKRINLVVMCYGETASFNRTKLIELIGITNDHMRPQCITSVTLVSQSYYFCNWGNVNEKSDLYQDKTKGRRSGRRCSQKRVVFTPCWLTNPKYLNLREDKIRLQTIT